LRDLQENIADFEYVAVMPPSLYGYARVLQTGNAEPIQIESALVSHDFFRVLGVSPVLGRDFRDSDEHVGAAPVVMVSDRVWRAQLESDPHIVGRIIRLNGQGCTPSSASWAVAWNFLAAPDSGCLLAWRPAWWNGAKLPSRRPLRA